MSTQIKAFAATAKGHPLEPFEFDPGPLGDEEVEIRVNYCGICHSDLSMLDNEWGMTDYPFVPGHEVIGEIIAMGPNAKRVKPGDQVGLGWQAASCMACSLCLEGEQHLCPNGTATIVHRHGGFADRVRCHWAWAIPLPSQLAPVAAGPLFCGGITVFSPIVINQVQPTDRVGVIGIGGLGHMARWGCEVTAFTSSEGKREEALRLGAHHAVSSRDQAALASLAGSLDFILSTVNVPLDWSTFIAALAPKGRLHMVGAVLQPMPIPAMSLIIGQHQISGSPTGNLHHIEKMLSFAARHRIEPMVETFPMSRVNEALEHLRHGKPRYRIVLENEIL
jgi:uncharacterized zinc-type alcohol dehydrogenase-like protein